MVDATKSSSGQTTPYALRVEAHARDDEIVLVFSGDADVATAPLIARALTQASDDGSSRVTVDLSALEFVDTYCLEMILDIRDKLRDRGADLVLRSPHSSVRRLLKILQREDVIECP
jgi:anti-sigma B factor antagonist